MNPMRAEKIRDCVVHIGSEKTGTTSIQNFFARNRDVLVGQGFLFPRSLAHGDDPVHLRLSEIGRGRGDAERPGVAAALGRECGEAARAGAHTAIISSEFLHSFIRTPAAVARVHKFLAPFFERMRIVYYARRQDHLLASMHSTAIRGGYTTNRSALTVYPAKGHHYFDHMEVCDLWSAKFGAENLICRIYERGKLVNGDIIDDFSSIVGLPLDGARARVASNESLSFETASLLLMLNGSVHKDNKELRRRLLATGRKRGGSKIPFLTKADAEQFLSKFDDSNRAFFSRYVDRTLASGFSAGFDAFPETIPDPPPARQMLKLVFGAEL
jgi:hypothetical protein